MMVNLAHGIAALGIPVDLVVKRSGSPYLKNLPEKLKLIELLSLHRNPEVAAALYLTETSPYSILTSKAENDILAIRAKKRAGTDTRIIIRVPVHITNRLKHKGSGLIRTCWKKQRLRRTLDSADSIIAVSDGVASDVADITGIPRGRIHVIRNPVVTPELETLSGSSIEHSWFSPKDKPVLIGMGRLGRQKNFEVLIRAFYMVRAQLDCRLLILGEGRRHGRLERLVRGLGMTESVQLPGFVENPYPYLAKADLFVLSSLWEGSPNALSEALALGVPVVSTDCESGPREILQNGKYGQLVPLGDTDAMASAIIGTLSDPPTAKFLKSAVNKYNVDIAVRSYLDVLLR